MSRVVFQQNKFCSAKNVDARQGGGGSYLNKMDDDRFGTMMVRPTGNANRLFFTIAIINGRRHKWDA